jgi:phytoene dehydrogenase-like protein
MHTGTIHIGCSEMSQIQKAYVDAQAGRVSERPIIEMTIPSAFDSTLAPAGQHVASLFVQYTPINALMTQDAKDAFVKRCFSLIDDYCIDDFTSSVLHYDILTPHDLETKFGLTGGNIFQGAMSLNQLFWLRPTIAARASHGSPIQGLYLCGAGAHPGGGVMGQCGYNAAQMALREWNNH